MTPPQGMSHAVPTAPAHCVSTNAAASGHQQAKIGASKRPVCNAALDTGRECKASRMRAASRPRPLAVAAKTTTTASAPQRMGAAYQPSTFAGAMYTVMGLLPDKTPCQ